MHYLGKLKRQLFICSADCETLPKSGTPIMTSDENEQKVGKIVTASKSNNKKIEFLAVIQIEKAKNNELHIESSTGPVLQIHELPYSLEKEEKQ